MTKPQNIKSVAFGEYNRALVLDALLDKRDDAEQAGFDADINEMLANTAEADALQAQSAAVPEDWLYRNSGTLWACNLSQHGEDDFPVSVTPHPASAGVPEDQIKGVKWRSA